LDNLLAMPEAV